MSLLLQALRKSEQRRQNGQPPPLGLPTGAAAGERTKPPSRGVSWVLVLLLAALVAIAVWWALGLPGGPNALRSSSGPEAPAASAAVAQRVADDDALATPRSDPEPEPEQRLQIAEYQRPTERERDFAEESQTGAAAATLAEARAELMAEASPAQTPSRSGRADAVAEASGSRGTSAVAGPGTDPAAAAALEAQVEPGIRPSDFRAAQAGSGRGTSFSPEPTERADPPEPVPPLASGPDRLGVAEPPALAPGENPAEEARTSAERDPRANTIDPWELPASLRSEFPGVEISVHVFAPDRAARFVLIGGERYGEGDTIADGVRLSEIHRGGVIVEFREYRIWIE